MCGNNLFNYKKNQKCNFGLKLTINHHSSVDQEEEKR